MDLNPNISMFRRLANNSTGHEQSSKDRGPQYTHHEFSASHSKELTDDSIEFHYRNDNSQLKPALAPNKQVTHKKPNLVSI